MTTQTKRDVKSFIEDCLEVFGTGSTASAADLGMAYRAWVGDVLLSDAEVVATLVAALGSGKVEVLSFGGSTWVRGAQMSPIGRDMVIEGRLMHLEDDETLVGAAARG